MSDLDIDELRQLERLCLEQAEKCARPEGRTALRSLAQDYRAGVERATPKETRRLNRPGRTVRT
jgi:hypothetical protein